MYFLKKRVTTILKRKTGWPISSSTACVCARAACNVCLNSSSYTTVQDGAPPHYANSIRNLMNTLPGDWIDRRGTIEWAPRSPNLTPMDSSCGVL